ncbi:MAG TPA: DUF2844 domain-containing protein [Steroidobacteraceae bacterium]|jgi:hypothetical protein|nr:DUF2844 domain-containing protein [Steroidobacteraceae bacterium]
MRPNPSLVRAAITAAAGIALAALATPSLASLGGTADSVGTDSSVLRGMLRSTPEVQYDVQEIDSSAVTVREYVTRAGQVFAVTWQGIAPPNFQQLLGNYYTRLQAGAAARTSRGPATHRHYGINQSDFVMQSLGRMGNFHGIAYIPALVPAGVDVGQLP